MADSRDAEHDDPDTRPPAEGADPLNPTPVLAPGHSDASLTDLVLNPVARPTMRGWWFLLAICGALACLFVFAFSYTIVVGIGAWGNNIPVAWAFGVINFVWWVGIGHAGTLISAILLLFQARWRTSINRFAEAMTLFAVVNAGLMVIAHMGRPWFAWWLVPYPSTNHIWPNFKSPLVWDLFAISTYLITSTLFWYIGLIPDLATLRDSATSKVKRVVYGLFALGWRSSGRGWQHWNAAYGLLAGLATPLVVSVHTIVSFDFAVSQLPGWHATIFPPYFVAGAVFSGFAMVVTLIIPARNVFGLKDVITIKHLENMNKVILATGWIVAYGYLMENFMAWYSGNEYEGFAFANRRVGPYAPFYWLMLFCNVVAPQIFWMKRARTSIRTMWITSILVNIGMWLERFVIISISLHRDFLPSSWRMYRPTWVDISIYVGTLGVFGTLFLLFLRFVPAVSASEVKELRHEMSEEEAHAATSHEAHS